MLKSETVGSVFESNIISLPNKVEVTVNTFFQFILSLDTYTTKLEGS